MSITPKAALAIAKAHSTIADVYSTLAAELQIATTGAALAPVAPTKPKAPYASNKWNATKTDARSRFRAEILANMQPDIVYDSDAIRALIGVQEHENNLYDWALVDLQGKSPLKLTPMIKKIAKKRYMLL